MSVESACMHERMWIRNVCMRGVMCVCAWEKVVSACMNACGYVMCACVG